MDHWESPGISDLGNFMPNFTRLLRTQSTLACVSCAGPVACLGWTVGQHDLERWFSKFQAELQPPKKHKIFRRWYSRCSSIFEPLWNATLAWSSKGIHGEMRFLYRFSLAIWQTHKPLPSVPRCAWFNTCCVTSSLIKRVWIFIFALLHTWDIILLDRRTIPAKCSREPLFSHVPTNLNVYLNGINFSTWREIKPTRHTHFDHKLPCQAAVTQPMLGCPASVRGSGAGV